MDSPTIKLQLATTNYVIQKNIEGLTHKDSLKPPQPAGNCANWVLGHIVRTRNNALGLVGREPLFPREKFDSYEINPVTETSALSWNELVDAFRALQKPLEDGLDAISREAMSQKAPFSPTGNPDETVGSLLATIAFHEAYHAGQLGVLRRVAGREGAIKSPEAASA